MAKVKIQGHASGTGVLTVTAPNTSTDRTITLPDATGTLLTADGDGSSLTGVGVAGITSAADATAITINSSENVGIGTSPSYRLHVETSVDGDFASLIHNTDADNGQGLMIRAGADSGEAILSLRNQASSEKFKVLADGRGLSQFTAKVWVHIDSGALADGHNVSSITDNGTGEYQVNFANNLANDNYSSTTSNPYRNGSSRRALVNTYNPNVNNINIAVFEYNHSNSNGFYAYDLDKCTMTIFGD